MHYNAFSMIYSFEFSILFLTINHAKDRWHWFVISYKLQIYKKFITFVKVYLLLIACLILKQLQQHE